MSAEHGVQNEVTPPKQCEFRGLENLKMHDIKGRRPLENRVFSSQKMLEKDTCEGEF